MQTLFRGIAEYVALGLESFSVIVIALGAVEAAYRTLTPFFQGRASQQTSRRAWLALGRWLLLGLEFMLAADVVRTAVSPSWNDIGELAAIALIRTFLNFFLERDLDAAARAEESQPRSEPA